MSVTTTQYTANSYKIVLNQEYDSEAMLTAIDTAIRNLGWGITPGLTAYDTVGTSSAGAVPVPSGGTTTSTYSPMRVYVYRAPNFDGTTYKYAILRFDTIKWQFWLTCAEGWNTTTKLATNESWNNVGTFVQHYDLRDGFIWVGGTARHLVIWPFIRNEPGLWTGIFEFERVAPEDTGTYPCFAWTNSLMIGTPYGNPNNNVAIAGTMYPSKIMFAFPRTPDGLTGAAAAGVYAPISSKGMHPPSYPNHNVGSLPFTSDTNLLHLGSHYNWIYQWDMNASKTSASPFSLDAITKVMPFGRTFDVGVTGTVGGFLDTTSIPANASGGWPDPTGTSADYVLLPMNGGPENYDRQTTAALSAPSIATLMTNNVASGTGSTTVSTSAKQKVFSIGANVWGVNNQGVWVWNTITSTMSLIYSSTGMRDIVFDGQRTVWGSTTTGVVKIDTETYAAVAYQMFTGSPPIQYLAIDQKYVYGCNRNTSLNPAMYLLKRSDFSTGTGNYSPTTGVAVATTFGTPQPDYQGGVYLATVAGTASSTQTMALYKPVGNEAGTTWTETTRVANPHRPTAGSSMATNIPGWWFDPTSGRIFLFGNSANNAYTLSIAEMATNLQTTLQLSTGTTIANINNNYFSSSNVAAGSTDYLGDLNIVPFRGALVFGSKLWTFNEGYKSISLASPYLVSSTSVVGSFNNVALTNALINANTTPSSQSYASSYIFGSAGAHTFWTNGPRVYFCTDTSASAGQLRYWANVYSLYNTRGGITGRLVLLG